MSAEPGRVSVYVNEYAILGSDDLGGAPSSSLCLHLHLYIYIYMYWYSKVISPFYYFAPTLI